MYKYPNTSEVKRLTMICDEFIHNVQKLLKDYFTFDIRLVGSGDKKLVTQNGENGHFDLDYNLIIQRDKKELIDNPKEIKRLFCDAFDTTLSEKINGYKHSEDSTSVITLKQIRDGELVFSFDVAILVEDNSGSFFRLIFDKNTNRYIWNKVPNSKDYSLIVKEIKDNDMWGDFRKRYLDLKNIHLARNDGVKSFSIFLETLNEFKQ